MSTSPEQPRSCGNCRNENQGRCEWARSVGDFCPPWVSEGRTINSDMGAVCNVWEPGEATWEK